MPRSIEVLSVSSLKQQAAYGTAIGNADLTFSHPFTGDGFIKPTFTKFNDADSMGKGDEWPRTQGNLTCDVQLSRTFDGSNVALARAFAFSMGKVSTTQPDPLSAPNTYEHTIEYMDIKTLGLQLPCSTAVEKTADYRDYLFRDLVTKAVKLNGTLGKQITVQVDEIGSGYYEQATLTDFPEVMPVSFLKTADATITIDSTDISAGLRSISFNLTNELDEAGGYHPGSPKLPQSMGRFQVRGHCLLKKRKVELTFKIKMENDDLNEDMLLNTERAIVLSAVGDTIEDTYNYKFELIVPRAKFQKVEVGVEDGMLIYDCSVLLIYDPTIKAPFKIRVTDTTPEYLAVAA